MSLPNRRPCITVGVHPLAASISFDPMTGAPCEVFITQRLKSGCEMEAILYDLGVAISKAMQGEEAH